jgi:hypothetical protein
MRVHQKEEKRYVYQFYHTIHQSNALEKLLSFANADADDTGILTV